MIINHISALKPLCRTTAIVGDGQSRARIVAPSAGGYAAAARKIQAAVRRLTGVTLPVVDDTAPEAELPPSANLICLGNRSTNRCLGKLYDLYFTLLDLKYPGRGGHVVHSTHNPFGNGCNVICAGGSDDAGVDAATEVLAAKLEQAGDTAGSRSSLSLGWLLEVRLGSGLVVPRDLKDCEIWEASRGYGSLGYFGWNSLSKRLALYFMTGDPAHAREFVRLAFPDDQAQREFTELDGERIENKSDPLAGSYHYCAHLMILYWDLVEESPVFSDDERLRITNALARQLEYRPAYAGGRREIDIHGIFHLREPAAWIGTRHNIYHGLCLFCLARYFHRDYPHPAWEQCLRGTQNYFAALREPHPFVRGELSTLYWQSTTFAPLLTYLLLSGDRAPIANGGIAELLRAQHIILTGQPADPCLEFASLDYLHKAAYLLRDGRFLAYRDRLGLDTNGFRLGQSFWPEPELQPAEPQELVGRWTVSHLPPAEHRERRTGFPPEESFSVACFRTAPGPAGDLLLINGRNSFGRHCYYASVINELRLAGQTLLSGYHNQVQTESDETVEGYVPLDAALRHHDLIGSTALVVTEVPRAPYCSWRRTVAQRRGRYALVVDELSFRVDSHRFEARFFWQKTGQHWEPRQPGTLTLALPDGAAELHTADPLDACVQPVAPGLWEQGDYTVQNWRDRVQPGGRRTFFALLGRGPIHCRRLADNAATLAVPAPALAVTGHYREIDGDLVVLAADHLCGRQTTRVELIPQLLRADAPVDLDWDFVSGELHVVCAQATRLTLAQTTRSLPPGRHRLESVSLSPGDRQTLTTQLTSLLEQARRSPSAKPATPVGHPQTTVPVMGTLFRVGVPEAVQDAIALPAAAGGHLCVAAGNDIHLFDPGGAAVGTLRTDGPVRMLRWWTEPRLLLAGCADDKLIAFDLSGKRRWEFVSEMHPAVVRAAKPYWMKSSTGHEGIHGLYTGVFLGGRSQAFVGSACTLEILDEDGRLLHRLPNFWGTGHCFAIVAGPAGSLELLVSRRITDVAELTIVSNRQVETSRRGYQDTPPGVTNVDIWGNETSHHIFVEDVDGDGEAEIIREITGLWNRVTVWKRGGAPVGSENYLDLIDFTRGPQEGRPVANVHFGPGPAPRLGIHNPSIPEARQVLIRDLELTELTGHAQKQIVVALASGWVKAFDGRCQPLWSARVSAPPTALKAVQTEAGETQLVAGGEDGSVLVFDGRGRLLCRGAVDGCVTTLCAWPDGVVVTTARGDIHAHQLVTR
jgi:hypothetical protein